MNLVEWIRSSSKRSLTTAIVVFLVATTAALALPRFAHDAQTTEVASALIMAGALVLAALVTKRSTFPRWSLVTAAAMFGAALVVTAGAGLAHNAVSDATYGWLFLMLLGVTPSSGPRWCHSPWALVACAALLGIGVGFAQTLR